MIVEEYLGVGIVVSKRFGSGEVGLLEYHGRRVVVCNYTTKPILKEELRRWKNGEPSGFSALWEELENPLI